MHLFQLQMSDRKRPGIRRYSYCMIVLLSLSLGQHLTAQGISVMTSEFVYQEAPFESCHASTLAKTPSGMVAAWFGGTHEKHKDVGIWVSRREKGKWSDPVEVVNGVQHADKRYPCWNPVLYYDEEWGLMLFYKVGPNPREWWGELMTSADDGKTWSFPRRLPEDILGPVKNKPERLSDGSLLCPSSTEHDGWRLHMEITKDAGKTWKRVGPIDSPEEMQAIQPSILFHPGNKLQLLCRSKNNRVLSTWSKDNGLTWSELEAIDVPNPNSGIDAVTVSEGHHFMVYNPTETPAGKWGGDRYPLVLGHSTDGVNWQPVLTLEDKEGEYSYPAIIVEDESTVHICYTWRREKIKYLKVKVK